MSVPVAVGFTGRTELRAALWEQVDAGSSLLLTGPAGVGKSRLAAELLDDAADAGWSTQLISATPAVQPVSFGAVHELLSTEELDNVALMNMAVATLVERAAGRRLLVVVDDIDSLDPESLALVDRLLRSGIAHVVATMRSENRDDARLGHLWKEELVDLVEVGPLDRAATADLTQALVGGPAAPELLDEVWELTEGNPLFVRELLLGARNQDRLAIDDDGLWSGTQHLTTTNRLFGIVSNRLEGLAPPELDGMVIIACSEPIDLVALDDVLAAGVVETLEASGFVSIVGTAPGRIMARTAHPLMGEVLREGSGVARTRTLLGRLAQRMLAKPAALDPDNRQRALRWALDAGIDFDHHLLLPAAERALFRFDNVTAAALAGPALEFTPSSRAAQILARALFLTRDYDAAAEAAQQGMLLAGTEEDRCVLLVAWADIEMFGRTNYEGGIVRLRHELPSFEQPESRAEIEMRIRVGSTLMGNLLETIDAAEDIRVNDQLPLAARVHVLTGLGYAMLLTGRCSPAERRRLLDGLALTRDDREYWVHNLLVKLLILLADVQEGKLVASTEQAQREAEDALDASERGGWLLIPALAAAIDGAGTSAIERGEAATELLAVSDPYGVALWIDGITALGHARNGDIARSADIVDTAEAENPDPQGRLIVFIRAARAWQQYHDGDVDAAAATAIAAATHAAEEEHFFLSAIVAHEVARMGKAELVVDDLERWADGGDSLVMRSFALHARALVDGDAAMLSSLGQRFVSIGAPAVGAEALAAAALRFTPPDPRRLTLAQVAAVEADWHESITLGEVDFLLSDRELQVALAAVSGRTNKEIATDLFVSYRTVGNHLHAVYRKLGVSTREDLARYLDVAELDTEVIVLSDDAEVPGRAELK